MAYAAVGLSQRALGFVLLPLYARALSPEEYGQVSLLLIISGAVGLILSFGLEFAVFRGFFQLSRDVEERERYLNSIGIFLLVVPNAVSAAAAVTILAFADLGSISPGFLAIELVATSIYLSGTVLPFALLRAEERLRDYVRVNATYAVTQTAVKSVLVLALGLGVKGWVLADLAASVAVLPVGLAVAGRHWRLRVRIADLRRALALGVPLLPHMLSHWALSGSDRLVLGALVSVRQLGVYSFGYQMCSVLGMILAEIGRASMPAYGRFLADQTNNQALTATATAQVLATALLGAGMVLVGPPVLVLLVPASYAGAADVIPLVALGFVFQGFYFIPMNQLSVVAGDTRWVWVATVVAAGVNVGLNVLTVPHWGITAAAFNTAVGYAVLLALVSSYRRIRHGSTLVSLDWRLLGPALAASFVLCLAGLAVRPGGLVALGIRGALGLVVAAIVIRATVASGLTTIPPWFRRRTRPREET